MPITDWHYGDPRCDVSFVRRVIEYVRTTPDCYAVSLGDLADQALVGSVGAVYEADLSPEEQILGGNGRDGLVDLLRPIKDKLLGFAASNHHRRLSRQTSYHPDRILAQALGAEIPYATSLVLYLIVGARKTGYLIYCHHGHGGGRTLGGKLNAASRLWSLVPCADIVLSGHTHTMGVTCDRRWVHVTPGTGGYRLVDGEGRTIVCGTALRWHESYAEAKGLPPAQLGHYAIHLHGRPNGKARKRIEIEELR